MKTNDIQIIKITVILIVSALTVFSMININKYITGLIDTQNEIEIKSKELQIKKLAHENYNNNKTHENSLQNSVMAIKEKINPYPTIQDDIIKLDNILTQNNLITTEFEIGNIEIFDYPSESQTGQTVYYATISLTAHGNYYNVLSAYNSITNNERWYDIRSLRLSSKEMQYDIIRLNTVFNIYFMAKTLPLTEKIETYNIYKNENPFNY